MSETLDIRTRWTDVADAVEELANHVDDTSVRVPCERPIADGEWVRFAVQLADGTAVLEGVGRAQGKTNGRLLLSLLQFDERNEIDCFLERRGNIEKAETEFGIGFENRLQLGSS